MLLQVPRILPVMGPMEEVQPGRFMPGQQTGERMVRNYALNPEYIVDVQADGDTRTQVWLSDKPVEITLAMPYGQFMKLYHDEVIPS